MVIVQIGGDSFCFREWNYFSFLECVGDYRYEVGVKESGVSSDGRLLFAGLWPLVSVLIALHMDDIYALFPARSLKYFFLASLSRWLTLFCCCLYSTNFFCFLHRPSVTWLALYQSSAMVEGFGV